VTGPKEDGVEKYRVTVTFTEPLLGTAPLNRQLYTDYIADSAPSPEAVEEEVMTIDEAMEKGTTGFHRLDGQPIIYDYVVKGFFKDAAGMLRRVKGTNSSKVTAYKKIIDGLMFVKPRQIPLTVVGELSILERPLRAQTAQGERVALSRSEMVAAGSSMEFSVWILDGITEATLREWLDYGALRGFGQWRNGGYGSFTYTMEPA
jgi:hypothetical protein